MDTTDWYKVSDGNLLEKSFDVKQGWIEKKSSANWKKRWVIVKGMWMLYSEQENECGDPKDKKQRSKFESINLLRIKSVERVDSGDDKTRFKVVVKRKDYVWRCETESERDLWVQDLQHRVYHLKGMVEILKSARKQVQAIMDMDIKNLIPEPFASALDSKMKGMDAVKAIESDPFMTSLNFKVPVKSKIL